MLADEHFAAREAITWVDSHDFGSIPMQNVVPKLSDTPGEVKWSGPKLGEHNLEVLKDILKLDDDKIAALLEQGIIQE